jgi:hypothetical protein
MIDLESIPYVPCRDQWPRRTSMPHIWIVLHSIESGEGGGTAEACASYFRDPRNANGTPRIASTQFVVDNNSTIRCAEWENRVAGAVGANDEGWHIEQAGVAAQSADQWRDDYSTDMVIHQTAPLVAALAQRDGIPLRFVDAAGLKRGQPGVTTHHECWKAFGGDVRTDPGPEYPMTEMLVEAIRLIGGGSPGEDEMSATDVAAIMTRIDDAGAATRDFLSARLEQVAAADRATMGALAQGIVEAIVRADADNATEEQVTQKRDELLAVIKPQLDKIAEDAANAAADPAA